MNFPNPSLRVCISSLCLQFFFIIVINAPSVTYQLKIFWILTVFNDIRLYPVNQLIHVILVSLKLPLPIQYQILTLNTFPIHILYQPLIMQIVKLLYIRKFHVSLLYTIAFLYSLVTLLC